MIKKTKEEVLEARINNAIETVVYIMGIDGDHHKVWALDKVIKDLAPRRYDNIVKKFELETGMDWDTGIEP